jgi:hypothetical protein
LQALNLLNDPQMLEAARVLGYSLVESTEMSLEEKVTLAFRKIISRKPAQDEIEILIKGYEEEYERFAANPLEAKEFLKVGDYPQDPSLDPLECAAMMHVVTIIYNLDEAISKS